MKRPEVPEAVRSRVPQRRSSRPWRLYLVGALITLAVASIATMVVKRRFGGADEELDANVEAAEQPSMGSVAASSNGAMSSEATTAEAMAAEATEEPASDEARRFSA